MKNNGRFQRAEDIRTVLKQVAEEWGGYSIRPLGGGFWKEEGLPYYDICTPLVIDVEDCEISRAHNWFKEKQEEWKTLLQQKAIYVTSFLFEETK